MNEKTNHNELSPMEENQPMPAPMRQRKDVEISESGIIQTKSIEDLYRVATALHKSGMLPKHFDSAEKVMTGLAMVKELGLPPINALRCLAIINGTPTLWGDMPLAMVRSSGQLECIKEYLIDKDEKIICEDNKNLASEIFAAVCEVKRKGQDRRKFIYTKMDAEKNPNKNNTPWVSYRSIMMKRKARSIALKDEFSEVLMGMPIAEYDFDHIPKAGDAIEIDQNGVKDRQQKKTDLLNDKLEAKTEKE